jgi:hypothetical protein
MLFHWTAVQRKWYVEAVVAEVVVEAVAELLQTLAELTLAPSHVL